MSDFKKTTPGKRAQLPQPGGPLRPWSRRFRFSLSWSVACRGAPVAAGPDGLDLDGLDETTVVSDCLHLWPAVLQ